VQLTAANECNQQLQVALQNEKLAAASTARNLEGKLADTEDCLLQKVREVATARDVQTGLRIELDSLKTMIENEEDRFVWTCHSFVCWLWPHRCYSDEHVHRTSKSSKYQMNFQD